MLPPACFLHPRRLLVPLVAALLFAGECPAQGDADAAGTYPAQPIRLIVPFGAGGGTDTFARVVGQAVSTNGLLPQPFVIINVGGAGATIGSRRVKNASPDGYTVLILHDAIITAKLYGTVDYGPEAFVPVAGTGEQAMVIAVREDSPYRNLRDLLKAARRKPDTIRFGANLGALTHYAGLLLEAEFPGAKFRYSQIGGGAERFAQLKGGHIDVTGFSTQEFHMYRSNGLRGLAFFGEERQPAIDDVPTAREQNIDIVLTNTFYWWVPKDTPQERIDVLAEALRKAMQTPEVQKYMREIHGSPVFVRGEELQQRIENSEALFSRVAATSPGEVPNYPLVVAVAIGVLVVLRVWQLWAERRRGNNPSRQRDGSAGLRRPLAGPSQVADVPSPRLRSAVAVIVLLVLYFAVLALEWVPFPWATCVFLLASGGLLIQRTPRSIAVLLAIALLLGFGLHAVLVNVFDVHFA